jgi:16S rRNA (adenine1518-N6/adenine1519-N6)-dimethyltransferase
VTITRRQAIDLLDRHGVRPSRALGQNFVVDPNTVRRIARLAGISRGDPVVEVGSGLGSLTLALVEAGADLTTVELDQHLLPVLREVLDGADPRPRIVHGDALTLDWHDLLAGRGRWQLVANLPYNIATPLVLDVLDGVPDVDRMVVMVQREVGERLAATPRTSAYGIPSVKVAYWADAQIVGRVGPNVFLPRPKVESVLVRIVRRPLPATPADPARLFTLVRTGFGQRRKMLRRSLAGLVGAADFARAGVAPEARAEELDVRQWGSLAGAPEQSE